MNRRKPAVLAITALLLLAFLLQGCGASTSSWEEEEVEEAGDYLLGDDVEAAWTMAGDPAADTAGRRLIRLEIRKKNDGGPIENFDITHEKLLHLIVVSKDLSVFHHIHPAYRGGGVFEIADDLPIGGDYRLIADFKPAGGDAMTKLAWATVEGQLRSPEPIAVTPADADGRLSAAADGVNIQLAMDAPEAGRELALKFRLTDEATGRPVTDLQPYLGAIGHVVILSADGERYVHVHAEEGQGAGPDAAFEATFPASGTYRIWAQFQRGGRVMTADYTVNVP